VPDATTVWVFRERLVQARAIDRLFARFDAALKERGYLALGGQIIDATVVPAPKQRNSEAEKAAIKEGRVPEDWKPAKVRQKDCVARWSIKYSKPVLAYWGWHLFQPWLNWCRPVWGHDPGQVGADRLCLSLGIKLAILSKAVRSIHARLERLPEP